MKRNLAGTLAALAIALCAPMALGQQEQWLHYATSQNIYESVGGTGAIGQKALDKAPEGVKLPQFQGDKPLFAKWESPALKGGAIWLAIDCSRKGGPYDTLYIDSNADGSLADEKPIKSSELTSQPPDYESVAFRQVKVLLPGGGDGPIAYHLVVQHQHYKENQSISLSSACWYEGEVTVGAKKLWCTLIDNTCNGTFNDVSVLPGKSDRIRLAAKGDRSFQNGQADRVTRAVGKYVQVDGQFYELEVAADGSSVKFTPARDVPMGSIRVAKDIEEFSVLGTGGQFFCTPKEGLVRVPAGEYRLSRWSISRKDERGMQWQLLGRGYGQDAGRIVVAKDEIASAEAMGGVSCEVQAVKSENGYSIAAQLTGKMGDQVVLRCNGSRPTAPKVHITNADGSYDKTFSMEYG